MYTILMINHGSDMAFAAGKTLKQQAEVLSCTHIYILSHGAAMALYMFLPQHAAIIEVSSHMLGCTRNLACLHEIVKMKMQCLLHLPVL